MSETPSPHANQPTQAEISALEREIEFRQQVAAHVAAGQVLGALRLRAVGYGFVGFLAALVGIPVAFALFALLLGG